MALRRKETSLSGATYQVFLSFRGPDTRLGFTDTLYHALTHAGIHVFRDNEEIRKGEDIGDEILMAIDESRIFVPIFSRGYASSKWCLIELSKMFESKEAYPNSNKKILPIFYDVDADDVKLKTQLYADPLLKHREKFSPDTVNQWEEALRKAGKIKGYDAKNRGYGEFAKSFVREVSMKLKGLPEMAPKRKGTSLSGATYQVFLSFRGPDTCLGFADVLYHALTDAGIRVFRDDEEIRKGEDIGDEILMAIVESRIFVPIFSSGYASSKWCLIELSKMFESRIFV